MCAGQVHVWRGRIDVAGLDLERYARTLSPDEFDRAGRFIHSRDRDRFVAARGFLRVVLGAYLGRPARAIRFQYGRCGKPALAGTPGEIGFNLSHSGDWALCAVAPARWVGADVERIRAEVAADDLMGVFSSDERAQMDAMTGTERTEAFFAGWTQKEAISKALGCGLSNPLDRLEVALRPNGAPRLVRAPDWPVQRWWTIAVSPERGYAGAIAVEGEGWSVRRWNGPPQSPAFVSP
jgi:4'-phosphopantetheinyl transferase